MARLIGRDLFFEVDGTDIKAECNTVVLENEDHEFPTYGQRRQYMLNITAGQDLSANSAWTILHDALGTSLDFTFAPYGNAVASSDQPHFTGTIFVNATPVVGGEIDGKQSFEISYELDADPVTDRGV